MIKDEDLTTEQRDILTTENKSLIVSASAGSGKTTVMIDKIARYIIDQKCHTNELLVLTYTKASAYEMKKKLLDELKNLTETHNYLEDELEKIQTSDVCTLDSFCQKLVKKYFYIINIDPSFNILSEEDQIYLKNSSIKTAIQQLQEQSPQKYETLLCNLAPARNNDLIEELIFEIYDYTTSILNPTEFFERTREFYSTATAESIINGHYNNILAHYIQIFENIKQQCVDLSLDPYVIYLSELIASLEQIKREPSLQKRLSLIQNSSTLNKIKADEFGLSKKVNEIRADLKTKVYDALYKHYVSAEAIAESYENCKNLIECLFALFALFEDEYYNSKLKINAFDFNDIEKLTIKLLENKEICEQIKNGYKYIFVDEFQDANAIQEKIIFMLQNNNLFFVGDTKQSIYAFRQSDPEIFLNIQQKFNTNENCESKKLNCNFRTNANILHFVNEIFSIIMTPKTCGLNYSLDSKFTPMAKYKPVENEKCVSLNLILDQKEDKKESPTKLYNLIAESNITLKEDKYNEECLFICNKITELLGQKIYDNKTKTFRPITYKDITILILKRSNFSKKLSQFFVNLNIPHVINSSEKLDECYDNKVFYQLLRYTLNQNDDYALTCLLTSPLFNFSDGELGAIKLNSMEEKYFYNCFKKYNLNNELSNKILNFNKIINQFFFDCKFKGIYYALNSIIRKTNYLLNISFDDDFQNRQENISQFINNFANSKFNFNIVDYIIFKENSKSNEKTNLNKPFSNAIQITTMHSSKGLEFPVVILPHLEQDFTKQPNQSCIKINKHLGIGIKSFNSEDRTNPNGIFYDACKIKNQEIELSEKIRLLYVATTRAKNKLILVGKPKTNYSKFKTDFEILSCNNFLSMIINSLDENIIEKINSGNEFTCNLFNNDKFEISQIQINEEPTITSSQQIFKRDIAPSENLSMFLNKELSTQKTSIALKNSVSGFSYTENSSLNLSPKVFTVNEHLSEQANKIGTLYHKLLEQINFNDVKSVKNIDDYIEYNFSDEEKELFKNISSLSIYNNILKIKNFIFNDSKVLKEQKFVMNVPYNEVVKSEINDKILVQGIIDLLIINNDNIVLIDYKLTHKNTEQIKSTYSKQLQLYEMALSKKFNLPIKKYIVNLYKSEIIDMSH